MVFKRKKPKESIKIDFSAYKETREIFDYRVFMKQMASKYPSPSYFFGTGGGEGRDRFNINNWGQTFVGVYDFFPDSHSPRFFFTESDTVIRSGPDIYITIR